MKSKKWLISVVLAVVLVISIVLAGCGDGVVVTPGKLVIGTMTDVPSLNMHQESLEHTNMGIFYKAFLYETLAVYAKAGDVVPGDPAGWYDTDVLIPRLAVGYCVTTEDRYHPVDEVMEEAQVWTVQLREGVKWHDGQDFTAEDVDFTIRNSISEWDASKPLCWDHYWENWEKVWWTEVTGNHTIELIYEKPISEAHPPSWWCWDTMIPEHIFGPAGNGTYPGWVSNTTLWDGEHIGTGPFLWEEHVLGDHHKWVKNDDWWGETTEYGPIEIEEIWFQIFPTMETVTAAFEADEIDTYVASFSYLSIPDFEADDDIVWDVVPGVGIYYLGFDLYTPEYHNYGETGMPVLDPEENPLHDVDLRKAIAYAVNVSTICEVVYGGYAELADSWVYTDSPGHNASLEMYEQNITKAENLLLNHDPAYYKVEGKWYSGYTDEQLEFDIHTSNDLDEIDTGQSIASDLEDFGIDMSHKIMDSTTFVDKLYWVDKDWDLFIGSEEPFIDPYSDWIHSLISDPWGWGWAWSPTYWYSPLFNELYEDIYYNVDPNVPRKFLQGVANNALPMYMLYRTDIITAWRETRWEGWYNGIGGPIFWGNPWSIYDLEWVGGS